MPILDESHDFAHPVEGDQAWSESYYFNFVDRATGVGAFTRMGFRPNDGWADGLHALYLGGDRVVWTYGRRSISGDDQDLKVGGLSLTRGEPFKPWTVAYHGEGEDIADPPVLVTPRKERPEVREVLWIKISDSDVPEKGYNPDPAWREVFEKKSGLDSGVPSKWWTFLADAEPRRWTVNVIEPPERASMCRDNACCLRSRLKPISTRKRAAEAPVISRCVHPSLCGRCVERIP